MTPHRLIFGLLTVTFLVLANAASAGSLTPETYCKLTVGRLKFAKVTWEQAQRSPTEAEQEALFKAYNTTSQEYCGFGGKHRKELERYLAANPKVAAEINSVGRIVRDQIQKKEAP